MPYLRTKSSLIVAGFIPSSTLIGLELPHQVDPPILTSVSLILQTLVVIVTTVIAFFPGAVIPLSIVAGVLELGVIAIEAYQAYCPDPDSDGDCD